MWLNKRLLVFFLLTIAFAGYQIFINVSMYSLKGWSKEIFKKRKVYSMTTGMKTSEVDFYSKNNSYIEERQTKRKLLLRKFCKRKYFARNVERTKMTPNVLYNDDHKFIYCSMPKTGCTNWKKVMFFLAGRIKDPQKIAKAKHIIEPEAWRLRTLRFDQIKYRMKSYYSFFFVRHPFERILAAYRNKLKEPFNLSHQRKIGSRILRLFRSNLTKDEYKKGQDVTFREFIDYIIHRYDRRGSGVFDEHWRPMHKICNPCTTKYSYIGKMETLQEDADQILKNLGLSEIVTYPTANDTDKYKVRTQQLIKEHYASIPKATLDKLYEIYKDDFDAFGYERNQLF